MSLRPVTDYSPADWFVEAAGNDADWSRPISLGPAGFEAYARVLHPLDDDQREDDPHDLLQHEGDLDPGVLRALIAVLGPYTSTPDDCCCCLWDGFGDMERGFPTWFWQGPRVSVRHRDYLLFTGPLVDAGDWGSTAVLPWGDPDPINSPNLFWPADRAWLVATEIDVAWTGVAGSRALIDALLADDRLDVVGADPTVDHQTPYR